MNNSQQTPKIFHIKENRITLFYFFTNNINIEQFNAQTLKKIGLPKSIDQQIEKQLNTQKLWTKFSYNITRDIKKSIHALFHTKQNEKPITSWQLNRLAIKLLNGKQAGNNKGTPEAQKSHEKSGLALNLTKAAEKRLEKHQESITSPQLTIENIIFHQFKTGFSVSTIELFISNKNPSNRLINEAIYALSRFNKISWCNGQGDQEGIETQKDYSLGDLMRDLLATEKSKRYKRVYTHSYIQLEESCDITDDQLNKYLSKLSLHLNDEYQLKNEEASKTIRDYDNITHCLAQEGAASSVVTTEHSPEFLYNYKDTVIGQVHIPIHLLTFHAEHAMEEYQINSQIWLDAGSLKSILLEQLQQNKQQLLNFELNFFHPIISNIDAHNRLYHSLIQVKRLDQQHRKISSDNQIISQKIIDNEKAILDTENKKRNLIYCRLAGIGVATAGYLTIFSIIKEFLKVVKHENCFSKNCPGMIENLLSHTGTISLVVALIAGIIALLYNYRRCACAESHHKHTPADLVDHANHVTHSLHLDDKPKSH